MARKIDIDEAYQTYLETYRKAYNNAVKGGYTGEYMPSDIEEFEDDMHLMRLEERRNYGRSSNANRVAQNVARAQIYTYKQSTSYSIQRELKDLGIDVSAKELHAKSWSELREFFAEKGVTERIKTKLQKDGNSGGGGGGGSRSDIASYYSKIYGSP